MPESERESINEVFIKYVERRHADTEVELALSYIALEAIKQANCSDPTGPTAVLAALVGLHQLIECSPDPAAQFNENVLRQSLSLVIREPEFQTLHDLPPKPGLVVQNSIRYLLKEKLAKVILSKRNGMRELIPTPEGKIWLQETVNKSFLK